MASRATVIDAACLLFAKRGYRGTSMKDIAETLGVSAPGLYNHVTSKQDILFAIMDKAMDRAIGALDAALAGIDDVSEELRRATESLVLDFLRYPAEVTVCNNEVHSLDPANRVAIVAKRDRCAGAADHRPGTPERPLPDPDPGPGGLRGAGNGQWRQILVPPQRALPGHLRGSRIRRVRPAHRRLHGLSATPRVLPATRPLPYRHHRADD
jgi:AcrR family transcriptional regulator